MKAFQLGAVALTCFVACTEAESPDAGDVDAGPADSEVTRDSGPKDAETTDVELVDAGHAEGLGFQLRVPQVRTIPCVGEGGTCQGETIEFSDRDLVCTLVYEGLNAYVYVQSTPTQYVGFMGPGFRTEGAWISDGVTAEPITASYDWGGGHHNEAIVVDLPQHRFQYWHSSFGFGFRACQLPDCIDVYQPGSADLVESGCTSERLLPVVCVAITETGELPALVDTFERCLGDG